MRLSFIHGTPQRNGIASCTTVSDGTSANNHARDRSMRAASAARAPHLARMTTRRGCAGTLGRRRGFNSCAGRATLARFLSHEMCCAIVGGEVASVVGQVQPWGARRRLAHPSLAAPCACRVHAACGSDRLLSVSAGRACAGILWRWSTRSYARRPALSFAQRLLRGPRCVSTAALDA